jgi:hypothetical protein
MKRGRASTAPKPVLSFTRRSDGVANPEQLASFLSGLAAGAITYAHPRFALNPGNDKMCTFAVSPETVAAISWWSKDFTNLKTSWADPATAAVLNRYNHHFNFAITGPPESEIEPGVKAGIYDRCAIQLGWLVEKCRELGQDPNASILVKVDPICLYQVVDVPVVRNNLEHIPALCEYMAYFGLSRLHISFTQFTFPKVKARLRKMSDKLKIFELDTEQQQTVLETYFFPHTKPAGIQLQTCTAIDLVKHYRRLNQTDVIQGACAGAKDIANISKDYPEDFSASKVDPSNRFCTCAPHRDVGDKTKACTHGCRYCFSNPKIYDF